MKNGDVALLKKLILSAAAIAAAISAIAFWHAQNAAVKAVVLGGGALCCSLMLAAYGKAGGKGEALTERTREPAAQESEKDRREAMKREELAVIDKFLSVLSHELRNPLASIKNIAYFFSEIKKDENQTVKTMVDLLAAETDKMNAILADLVESIRRKESERTLIRIDELVRPLLEQLILPEEITVVSEMDPVEFTAEPQALRQMFLNLLKNARGSITGKGEIRISVKKTDTAVRIVIGDTGCGMDEHTAQRIFEPLFTTKPKGVGMGLTVVSDIVRRHNGSIAVESEVGKGTKIIVTLPL